MTTDFYPVFDATGQSSEFIAGFAQPTPIALRGFKANTQPTCRFYPAKYNPSGGYGAQYSAVTATGHTLIARLMIRTASTTTQLATTGVLTWNGSGYFEGVFDLNTTEVRTAIASLAQGEFVRVLMVAVMFDTGSRPSICGQVVPLFWAPVPDDLPDPTSVTDTIFANLLEAALQDTNSIGWTRDANHLLGAVRRKTGGGIYEDADGLYVADSLFYADSLFTPLSVAIAGAGSPSYTATPSVDTDSAVIAGVAGERYAVRIQVEFSTEVKGYAGGIRRPADSTYFCQGGTPGGDDYNILSLTDGTTVWHLNRAEAAGGITTATYEADIEVVAGATLTLTLDSKDGLMIGTSQSATVTFVSAVKLDSTATEKATLARLEGFTTYELTARTTDATPTELLAADGSRITLANYSAIGFRAMMIARTGGPTGAYWTARDSNRNWQDIACSADGTKLVAVVSGGYIYTSTDSGATWTARDSSRTWLACASSADGVNLAATVSGGQIYTSTDSGATWTARASGSREWFSIASSDDGTKLVACDGTPGYLYTSTDSGVTWTQRSISNGWRSVASSSDGTKLVACASSTSAYIYTSTDSGVNWTQRASSRQWLGVASSSDGTKLAAVAYSGQIYTSTDSGVTWTARASARDWSDIACSSDGTSLIACAAYDDLYISTDSGVTWTAKSAGALNWRRAACSADFSKLSAIVLGGKIYTSADSAPSVQSVHFAGTASRGSNAASTVVEVQENPIGSPTYGFTCQADTTNGALQFQFTGAAATNARSAARVDTIELAT